MQFYENGQLKIAQQYSNEAIDLSTHANKNSYGDRIGIYQYFYSNGQLRFSLNYAQDKIEDGLFKEYYPNGQLKRMGPLKKGRRDSTWSEFYENAQLKARGKFRSGKFILCGSIPAPAYYEYKIGEWEYYHANGALKAKGTYKASILNITTGCQGGAYVRTGQLTKDWNFLDASGIPILARKAIKSEFLKNKEVFMERVYHIN